MPTAFTPASRATAVRLGYRFSSAGLEDDDPADRPGGRGFGRLQLPSGCVDLTEVAASWRGSKLALADVLCGGSDRKPFATAAVQLARIAPPPPPPPRGSARAPSCGG